MSAPKAGSDVLRERAEEWLEQLTYGGHEPKDVDSLAAVFEALVREAAEAANAYYPDAEVGDAVLVNFDLTPEPRKP